MSNRNKPRLSLKGDPNVPTTEPIEPAPAETRKPTQEKTMEANPNQTEQAPEPIALTAKEEAAAEERQAAAAIAAREAQNASAPPDDEVNIVNLASKGYDALHEAMRKVNAHKPKPYVPPPMTARQLSNREEELEAGRRAVARATEQLANRPAPPNEVVKEGFTTPMHRPNDFVPGINSKDPAITR